MVFRQCVCRLVSVGGDALRSRYINERPISHRMGLGGHCLNRLQFRLGIQEAFFRIGLDVVVDLNPEYAVALRASEMTPALSLFNP